MSIEPEAPQRHTRSENSHLAELRWAEWRDSALTVLAWLLIAAGVFWAAVHLGRTLLMLIVAGLIAYALYPGVRILSRYVPRSLAILLVYLVLIAGLGGLVYLLLTTAFSQITLFAAQVRVWLATGPNNTPSPLRTLLDQLGISQTQIDQVKQQVVAQAESLVQNLLPLVGGVVNAVLDIVLTAILSVYLLVDGARLGRWLRTRVPVAQRDRVDFLVDTQQRVVGGYIRGQLLISTLVGVLVTAGMLVAGVPFAILLGMLSFILVFVPVVGTIASGAACVLVALTQGWVVAVAVLGYFVLLHVAIDDFVAPRVMGRSVGIHPAVSIVALVAGGEIFGLWGALLAVPLAGLLQAIAAYVWIAWRETHKDQFPEDDEEKRGDGPHDIAAVHGSESAAKPAPTS